MVVATRPIGTIRPHRHHDAAGERRRQHRREPRLQHRRSPSPPFVRWHWILPLDAMIPCRYTDEERPSCAPAPARERGHRAMTSGDNDPGRGRRMARPLRQLRAHPRLVIAVAIAVACYFLWPGPLEWSMRMLIAFDVGAVIFIAAIWFMMARATQSDMRWRAAIEDEGRNVILALAATAAVAILLAIVFELHGS